MEVMIYRLLNRSFGKELKHIYWGVFSNGQKNKTKANFLQDTTTEPRRSISLNIGDSSVSLSICPSANFTMWCFFMRLMILLLFLIAGVSPAFAHGGEQHSDNNTVEFDKLKTCLFLETGRPECYASLCEGDPGYLCAEDILDQAVPAGGPEKAMRALHDVMQSPVFPITADGHLLSHVIGRSISKNFGSTGENFMRCPSDFNNGCFHGFFEDTLVKVDDPAAVAESICESMPDHVPIKEKSYCYHGAGHVFMMDEAHHLDRAIELCLSLPERWPRSCWQGVFMENAGEREWELKKKNFREDALLYPCTHVEDKFKPECYINHHGYLIRHYSKSWDALAEVCMGAGNFTRYCIGGMGLMLSSPYWVNVVAEDYGIGDLSREEKVVTLCDALGGEHAKICYQYVIPGFLNFYGTNLTLPSRICSMADKPYRHGCFERAGSYLTNLVNDSRKKQKACDTVPAEYKAVCLGVDVGKKGQEVVNDKNKGDNCSGLSGESRKKCLSGFAENPDSFNEGGIALPEGEDPGKLSFFQRLRRLFAVFFRILLDESFDSNSGDVNQKRMQEQEKESLFPVEVSEEIIPVTERTSLEVEKTEGAVIRYVNGRYVPGRVHVSVGDEVKWVNEADAFWPASNLHPTHKEYPGSDIRKCYTSSRETLFDSCEALGRGAEYSFVFEHPGEWRFHDHINPSVNGIVIVSR